MDGWIQLLTITKKTNESSCLSRDVPPSQCMVSTFKLLTNCPAILQIWTQISKRNLSSNPRKARGVSFHGPSASAEAPAALVPSVHEDMLLGGV